MKIRKFNESVEPIDIEYIRQCFIDLIDEGKAEVRFINQNDNQSVNVILKLKSISKLGEFGGINQDRIGSGTYFERYVREAEQSVETMKMASDSISRLADEYPDYRLVVYSTDSSMYLTISS